MSSRSAVRLKRHPVLQWDRGRSVTFRFEGKPIKAFEGETVAAALHAAGVWVLSRSRRFHRPRGLFCAIGKCASCMMEVNGIPNIKTCLLPVAEGLDVRMQDGEGRLLESGPIRGSTRADLPKIEMDVAVIGAGPAGLCAATAAANEGIKVALFDENPRLGGQLIKQTHRFFGAKAEFAGIRGMDIAGRLLAELPKTVDLHPGAAALGMYPDRELLVLDKTLLRVKARSVVVAAGASENHLMFENNDLPGVYGAGAVQTLMNVHGILPGRRFLMVGAGNIGLIVAYQLIQAGAKVVAVVEAAPRIGGYRVHASKLRRAGVPILLRHTILKVTGRNRVRSAVTAEVDDKFQPLPNTEQKWDVDTVCLAVGLKPSVEILAQGGCRIVSSPDLGGEVPWRDENLETSLPGVFVAGDASGIEEASTAMLEGRLAGLCAAEKLIGRLDRIASVKADIRLELDSLRAGPFGNRTRRGLASLGEKPS